MDGEQQKASEKRQAEAGQKAEYRLQLSDRAFYVTTKAEYDYAAWVVAQQKPAELSNAEAHPRRPRLIRPAKVRHSDRHQKTCTVTWAAWPATTTARPAWDLQCAAER